MDEIGPAHKKKFFVSLKLDIGGDREESFTANSTSIKKAQHAAAEIALKQTKFKKSVSRSDKLRSSFEENLTDDPAKVKNYIRTSQESYKKRTNPALAPTVLLNSLAMKLNLVANYTHTLTSATDQVDLTIETNKASSSLETENQKQQALQPQTNTSFTSDLNQSFEIKSSNYTNFTKNDYEPFKYPQESLASSDSKTGANAAPPPSQIKVLVNPNKDLFNNIRPSNVSSHSGNNYKGLSRIKKKTDGPKQYFYVKLTFADTEFNGEGNSLQMAKHDAASKALSYFSIAENFLKAKELSSSTQNKNAKAYRPPQFYKQHNESGMRFIFSHNVQGLSRSTVWQENRGGWIEWVKSFKIN